MYVLVVKNKILEPLTYSLVNAFDSRKLRLFVGNWNIIRYSPFVVALFRRSGTLLGRAFILIVPWIAIVEYLYKKMNSANFGF